MQLPAVRRRESSSLLPRTWSHQRSTARRSTSPQTPDVASTSCSAFRRSRPARKDSLASVAAGLDQALWDLVARRHQAPLWQVLGGTRSVHVYASGIDPEQAIDTVDRRARRGPSTPSSSRSASATGSTSTPSPTSATGQGTTIALMADANQAWSPRQALEVAERLAPFRLEWLEEPIRADEPFRVWRELSTRSPIPLAAGENIRSAHGFTRLIESRLVTHIQPDVGKWGGVSHCLAIGRRAADAGIGYSPTGTAAASGSRSRSTSSAPSAGRTRRNRRQPEPAPKRLPSPAHQRGNHRAPWTNQASDSNPTSPPSNPSSARSIRSISIRARPRGCHPKRASEVVRSVTRTTRSESWEELQTHVKMRSVEKQFVNSARHSQRVAEHAESLVRSADPQPGQRLLDVGCGNGAAPIAPRNHVRAGSHRRRHRPRTNPGGRRRKRRPHHRALPRRRRNRSAVPRRRVRSRPHKQDHPPHPPLGAGAHRNGASAQAGRLPPLQRLRCPVRQTPPDTPRTQPLRRGAPPRGGQALKLSCPLHRHLPPRTAPHAASYVGMRRRIASAASASASSSWMTRPLRWRDMRAPSWAPATTPTEPGSTDWGCWGGVRRRAAALGAMLGLVGVVVGAGGRDGAAAVASGGVRARRGLRPVGRRGSAGLWVAAGPLSGEGRGERADAVEGVGVVAVPGPAGRQVQRPSAGVPGQPAGDVQ